MSQRQFWSLFVLILLAAIIPTAFAGNSEVSSVPTAPPPLSVKEGVFVRYDPAGVTSLIFLRLDANDQPEVFVPKPPQPALHPLWNATMEWLAMPSNRSALKAEIQNAWETASAERAVFAGRQSRLAYVKASFLNWYAASGARSEISAHVSRMVSSTGTSQGTVDVAQVSGGDVATPSAACGIPVCDTCEQFKCLVDVGRPELDFCYCTTVGLSCCVIGVGVSQR